MTNEDVIVQALTSIDYQTAKNAIRSFYKAVLRDKIRRKEGIKEAATKYVKEYHEKIPPVVGPTFTTTKPIEKSISGSEGVSSLVCPRCGDSIEHSDLCPACKPYTLGYRYKYSCVCGVNFITTEKL